jgi:hypothetical protein
MNEVMPIPKPWREGVCKILDAGDFSKIKVPIKVFQRWEEMFADEMTTLLMMCARTSEALKNDAINGIKIETMRNEQGEVYEFLFPLEDKDVIVYAKVSLRLANGEVFFYSAHRAERSYL